MRGLGRPFWRVGAGPGARLDLLGGFGAGEWRIFLDWFAAFFPRPAADAPATAAGGFAGQACGTRGVRSCLESPVDGRGLPARLGKRATPL